MGNKNNINKKNLSQIYFSKINTIKQIIHKDQNRSSFNAKDMNNINLTENIVGDYVEFSYDNKSENKNESIKSLSTINNNKPLKSFENNTNKKSIKFYYNNEFKVIKYWGKFEVESVKKILKSHFSIEESIDSIFFKDEDEDILILNSNIPDNLTVYLFIQKDLIPKNPAKAIKIPKNINSKNKSEKPLLKFYWILENDKKKMKFADCVINKYTYKSISCSDYINPSVRSSVSFTIGTYFFVLRIGIFQAYESLAIVEDEAPDYHNIMGYNFKTFVGYEYMECNWGYYTKDIAIYIDMEKKKCRFYDYEKKKILLNGRINSDSVKLYAWIKDGARDIEKGMTILNEGCIPIPDWVKP